MINDFMAASLVGVEIAIATVTYDAFNQKSRWGLRRKARHKSTRHSPHVWILCVQLFFLWWTVKKRFAQGTWGGHKNRGKDSNCNNLWSLAIESREIRLTVKFNREIFTVSCSLYCSVVKIRSIRDCDKNKRIIIFESRHAILWSGPGWCRLDKLLVLSSFRSLKAKKAKLNLKPRKETKLDLLLIK